MRVLLAVSLTLLSLPLGLCLWIGVSHLRFHLYHRRTGRSVPALGLTGWTVFYVRTMGSILRLSAWAIRARGRDGLRLPVGEVTGGPVLCIHGFHLTGTSMWGIRRTLEARGRPTRAVFLGPPHREPEVYADSLRRVLGRLRRECPGQPIDVVAHSMGGLVLRQVMALDPELAAAVERIVTLGTPHHGTAVLRWFRSGSVYRMMSLGSRYVRELPDFRRSVPHARVTTVATAHDLVVYPVETAHLAGARQITLQGVGHLGLLTERRVRDRIAELLAEAVDSKGPNPLREALQA